MDSVARRELHHRTRVQAGALHRAQAAAMGISRDEIATFVRRGDWAAEGRRLLRIAAFPRTAEQALWMAYLELGPSAVVSHHSAAWLWDLREAPERHALTAPRSGAGRTGRATVHRPVDYPAAITTRRGLACTNPLRTIVDLAGTAASDDLTAVIDRAIGHRLVTVGAIEAERRRLSRPGRAGTGLLRHLLEDRALAGGHAPSMLERRALRLFRQGGIPPLETERREGPDGRYRVDMAMSRTVVVEVDGWAYHASPEQKADDERRRNRLRLSGLTVLVYTWRDIAYDGFRVLEEVRLALTAERARPA